MSAPLNAETTRGTYVGRTARTYERLRIHEERWRRENKAVEEFLRGVQGTVLDLPVGTGRFLPLYRRLGLTAIGMDVSEDMMRRARTKRYGTIRRGDIMAIPLPGSAVETAVCVRLLNLMTEAEMECAVAELGRVARDRIILSIRTGPEIARKPRSWTHRHQAFERAVAGTRMRVAAERAVEADGYRVALLER